MATTPTKPHTEMADPLSAISVPDWTKASNASSRTTPYADERPAPQNALQTLLAFSALHEQVRRRKALGAKHAAFESTTPVAEFEPEEQFVLDEVLQLVAERAVSITGADGLAIALAENNEIVLRAAAGTIRPDVGARIDRDSAFSGACFRTAQVVNCDDTETDSRVNLQACRKLGARSMVAVPLCGRRRVIGLLEAFSSWPFGFNDSDVRNLTLLAELVLAALKPEDEDRFASSAQIAVQKLEPSKPAVSSPVPEIPSTLKASAPSAPVKGMPQLSPISRGEGTTQPIASPSTPAAAISKPSLVQSTPAAPAPAQDSAAPTVAAVSAKTAPATPQVLSVAPAVPAVSSPAASAAPAPKAEEKPALKPDLQSETNAKADVKSDAKPGASVAAPGKSASVAAEKAQEAAPEAMAATAAPTTAEPAPELKLSLGQTEPAPNYRWIPIVLIFIVITAAFAAGAWWKLKTAQLGSEIVRGESAANSSSPKNASPSSSRAANLPPANSATAGLDQGSDQDGSEAPAAPQELSKFPRVTGVRHWSSPDSSTVVLDLEDQVQYEPHRLTGPDRIYFDLRNTQLAADLTNKSIDIGDAFITRIRMAQPVAGMTRVVLETKANTNFSVSLEPNPYRLIVEVSKVGATPKGAVNLFPDAGAENTKLAITVPPPTREDLQLRARVPKMRIVVDAGHGGWDLGTVGRRGLLEKDLVLEIAERLGKLLESRLGSEVIYTRQDDTYIPLDERAEIANQAQADLFVSVHANYSDLISARGVETYYTNSFSAPGSKGTGSKDADAHSVAGTLQNAVLPTLSSGDLHERIEMSRRLAASVQRSLYGTLSVQNPGLRDRGIKEAGFVVLTESAMPGILAEVSFVSSPTDEQKLRSDGYREQIAEALYRGIAKYAVASKGVKLASAAK
jgi:N-acetylmuramoyl-L-alanine amidase/putative methionine-R-sulfoxide reductase with GAF domain